MFCGCRVANVFILCFYLKEDDSQFHFPFLFVLNYILMDGIIISPKELMKNGKNMSLKAHEYFMFKENGNVLFLSQT